MGFSGNLRTVPLTDVLQLLAATKKTGTLRIASGDQRRDVYMRTGMVVYASSTAHEDLLGNILVRRGKLSRAQIESAIAAHRKSGKRLGETLIELGYLSADQVMDALRFQVEEIVYGLFSWTEGDFMFDEGKLPELQLILDPINTINLVMEGTRRIDEWAEIQKSMPPANAMLRVVAAPKAPRDEIRLSAVEFLTISHIDGDRTVGEIIDRSVAGEFMTSKAIHTLLQQGYVEVGGRKRLGMSHEEQEEELLRLVGRMYGMAFRTVWTTLVVKFGRAAAGLVDKRLGKRRAAYQILSKLAWGEGLDIDEKSFYTLACQIESAGRLHRLLSALSGFLDASLVLLVDLLGDEAYRKVMRELRRESEMVIARAPVVDGLDLLTEDFERVLSTHRI